MWQRLQEQRLAAQALQKDKKSPMTASLGVLAAFELSWQALTEPAQQLAAVLSLFALAEILWSWVEGCLPEVEPETLEDLPDEELLGLSLLSRAGTGLYELHPLVREFFAGQREQLEQATILKQIFCKVMVRVAEQIPYSPTLSVIQQVSSAIPHLQESTTNLEPWLDDEDLKWPANGIARFHEGQSAFTLAEYWYSHNCQIIEKRLGADHPNVAASLNNLARLYVSQGRYSDAEPLYLRSQAIWEQQLGADHPYVATSLWNLAVLYHNIGRHSEAKPLIQRAVEIMNDKLGDQHPSTISARKWLKVIHEQ